MPTAVLPSVFYVCVAFFLTHAPIVCVCVGGGWFVPMSTGLVNQPFNFCFMNTVSPSAFYCICRFFYLEDEVGNGMWNNTRTGVFHH